MSSFVEEATPIEIAKMLHVSFRDISRAIKMYSSSQLRQDELEHLKKRVEELDNSLANAIEDLGKLESRVGCLEKVVGALVAIIRGYEEAELRSRIDEVSRQVEALRQEVRSLHSIAARHSKEEADLHEDLRKLSSPIDMLGRELSRLREAYSRYERAVSKTLSLLKEYIYRLYELLYVAMEHLGLKPTDAFSKHMAALGIELENEIPRLSKE